MDTPPIQYVKTSDGVSIAYYAMGGGPGLPVVWIDLPSHLQIEPFPAYRTVHKAMSRLSTLVRYDHRGFGLSERSITKFPLEDLVKDLEAVVDKLALEKFILVSAGFAGLVPVAYAALHPRRVAKLAVAGVFRIAPALHQQYQAVLGSSSDWRFVSEAMARVGLGWEDDETSRALASWYRESCDHETFKCFWRDVEEWDVGDLLPSVAAPTLIVAVPSGVLSSVEQAREMASIMPHAQMVVGEGATNDEIRANAFQAAASFVYGPDAARPPRDARTLPSGTAIILFADIVDSTALTEKLGDTAFREKARALDDSLRAAIKQSNGTTVEGKLLGDGVLAVFTSARDAITAALACRDQSATVGLELHLGLHAGDVIREKDNIYGGAVNIASRISALSAPGEVLVSRTITDLARTSAGVSFDDRGDHHLKGIEEPQRIFAVRDGTT